MPRFGSLLLLSLPVLIAGLVVTLPASPAAASDGGDRACVQLLRMGDGDHVVNRCGVCRAVSVARNRPGSNFPRTDTLVLPMGGSQRLPYQGPGQTRILGEQPCTTADAGAAEPINEEASQCVGLVRSNSAAGLVNGCWSCRVVAIEQTRVNGGSARESYVLAPSSVLPLRVAGLARVQIVKDDPCQRGD